MPLQPLTPAGVSAKCTELYGLTDLQLAVQSDAAEEDFSAWISANFSLTIRQADYLAAMNSHAVKYYGMQCSMAFRSRLSVSLVWPSPILGYTKWTFTQSTLKVSTNEAAALETAGTLTFEMEYRP